MGRRTPDLALMALLALPVASAADDGLPLPYKLGASITAGYRFVDVDGSTSMYRDDYDLHSGPRLFNLDMSGVAAAPDAAPIDRFHLVVDTPGNEPVSTYFLSASDAQNWDLRANLVRSKYFYAVPELFETPVPGDVRLEDLHAFDQTRTNGSVDLTIRRPHLPTIFLGYRLYQLEGDTTSTIYEPGGDTFVVRAPEDTRANVGRIGTEFRALGTDVFLQEEYRRVTRSIGGHGPLQGGAAGVDPTDASTLSNYQAFGAEQVDTPTTTVRLRRPIGERLDLSGAYLYSHATLEADWSAVRNATSDDPSVPTRTRSTTHSTATLDTQVADLGATYRLGARAALHASYRFDERVEHGGLDQVGTQGPLVVGTGDHVRLNRLTAEVEVEPRRDLSLRAGVRYAWQDVNLSSGDGPQSTGTLGAIADVRYRPCAPVDLFLRYENAQIDDPYTIAGDPSARPPLPGRETTLTVRNRGSAGLTVRPWTWATLSYRLVADSGTNGSFDARSQAFGNSATVTLTPLANLTFFGSYTRRDLDNRADIDFAPSYARATSVQSGSEDVLVSQLTYDFGLAGERWQTGWNVYYVQSDQQLRPRFAGDLVGRTAFDLDRVDAGAFLTWVHPWVEPTVEVRRIDYNEPGHPRNDYQATIIVVKLTRRFGTSAIH